MDFREQATAGLPLPELRRSPPRLVATSGPTLFTIATAVVNRSRAVPGNWVAAARRALDRTDLAALMPIGQRTTYCPDVAALVDSEAPTDVPAALERLTTLEEPLLQEVDGLREESAAWDAVARAPRRWLVLYARALGRIWRAVRPHWAAAGALLERERARVAAAVEHDALPELMNSLDDRGVVDGDRWLPHPGLRRALAAAGEPPVLRVPRDGTRIMPVLAAPGSTRFVLPERGVLGSILSPLPGIERLADGELLPPATALEILLGAQRAAVLRLLDRPQSAGRIACRLKLSPGAVTHHLKALEASGLVVRERDSRHVVVHRTDRGTRLLALYADDDSAAICNC